MRMKPFIEGGPLDGNARIFWNGRYQAIVTRLDTVTWLSIRREDRRPVTDWRDVQWIKNQLLGPETEAVQLFPAESRLVDTSNQFHLFALPAGERFPFGFAERCVSEAVRANIGHGYSVQRPFADHVRPADLAAGEARLAEALRGLTE